MARKRNPKSKRVHDSDSGKFISEDKINSLTPFGYNDGNEQSLIGRVVKFLAWGAIVAGILISLGLL